MIESVPNDVTAAVACFDLRSRAVEPFGAFSSLADFSDALEARCRDQGHRPTGPVSVDRNGYGIVRVAEADGTVVGEYHLIVSDGSRFGRRGGVAGFAVVCDGDGSVFDVHPCGIYASEAEIRDLDAFGRRVIKGMEDAPSRWLIIPFSGSCPT